MNEFALIDAIVAELGGMAAGDEVLTGPGDDAAVTLPPPGMALVSTIDAVVGGVHVPAGAAPALIGYRALMISVSDLAAMGAAGAFALVALSLEGDEPDWVRELARGMARAARDADLRIVGGNIARGPLNIAVSAHGYVPPGAALLRSGARPGDGVYVTGELGGAAAALTRGGLARLRTDADLDALSRRYFLPQARLAEGLALRGHATSAIDLSDGLAQDLGHVCEASGVGVALTSGSIPVAAGASLEQALSGGDDYELCFTLPGTPPALDVPVHRIGRVEAEPGVRLDGRPLTGGYRHFDP
ncbi:MAG: thiamine-phosphate kinase [bacterium]